ncbi:hypothetical protein O0L34_g10016 [Tuta absoluta]|nr:hypothetical protein O0L34_g10016 [Tuta absoluta]
MLKKYLRILEERNERFDETTDAYLVQAEQNLRAFCLNLASISHRFTNLPDDRSFTIHLHTNESTAVALASNPDLEDFPLIEVDDIGEVTDFILPLRRFSIRNFSLDTYVEIK